MAAVRRLTLALVVGLLLSTVLGAQTPVPPSGTITGRVIDAGTQQPVADVSVFVEGTRRGAVTAADGTFTIGGVPAGSQTVRARRIGFAAPVQIVTVPNNGSVSVVFSLDRQAAVLQEVVTTGYGTQRRLAITGSVATVDADQARTAVPTNATQLFEGRATGVQVTQNSGEPGAGAHILIRGGTSISGGNEPLFVIDGVAMSGNQTEPGGFGIGGDPPLPRNPLNMINPADIQSVTILKDAAATAIYGARAANGVILIETKKGSTGGPSIEYNVSAGMSSNPRHLNVLNGDQYRQFIAAQVAAGVLPASASAGEGAANTNWEDAVMRTAPTVNHDLSFSGGSPNTQYRASLNFFNQEGSVIANGLRRYQARVNGTHQAIDGRLRLGLNLTGSHVKNDYLPWDENSGFEGGVFVNMVTFNPTSGSSRELDIVGGYEFNQNTINEFGVETRNYLTDAFTFNSLGSGNTLEPPYAFKTDSRIVSFFGRANAGLLEKYFFTFVVRKDGASQFGANHKWATFPAISGSWRLSQEGFMRSGPFSELRLRAGWGKQGNPAVPPYSSLILLGADGGSRYAFGDKPVTGVTPQRNANPDLKWEETAQTNFALDYGILNNRLNGSLEYYVKNTHDLLLTVQVPQPAVVGDRLENIGRIRNKGVEFSLDGLVMQRGPLTWNAGFVFSHDKNTVVDLGGRP